LFCQTSLQVGHQPLFRAWCSGRCAHACTLSCMLSCILSWLTAAHQKYAENTLFGTGRTQLRCMNGSEPCNGRFTDDRLQRALSEKVYRRYVEAEALDATRAANIDGLVQC